jgi:hypothetical protein
MGYSHEWESQNLKILKLKKSGLSGPRKVRPEKDAPKTRAAA